MCSFLRLSILPGLHIDWENVWDFTTRISLENSRSVGGGGGGDGREGGGNVWCRCERSVSADTSAFVSPAECRDGEPEWGQCVKASVAPSGSPSFCHELGTWKIPEQGEALEQSRFRVRASLYLQPPAKGTGEAREGNKLKTALAGLEQIWESRDGNGEWKWNKDKEIQLKSIRYFMFTLLERTEWS